MEDLSPPAPKTGPISHLDLLGVADIVGRAALERDLVTLHRELGHLHLAMIEHVGEEEKAHASLPPATRAIVRRGQEELVQLLGEVVGATAEEGDDCPCVRRAAEVHRALSVQARLETRALLATAR